MDDIEVIKLVFGILLAIGGVILLVLGRMIGWKYVGQKKRCTKETTGVIENYRFRGDGGTITIPYVGYEVNGTKYHVLGPRYKGYVISNIPKRGVPQNGEAECYVDQHEVLHVKINSNRGCAHVKDPVTELYPIGMELPVFYDPVKPKNAYVLRYCDLSYIFWLFTIAGAAALMVDLLLQILL